MFENKNPTKIILLWQIPKFYQKAAIIRALMLKSGIFRFYAPLRIPSKRKRAAGGKILELPEPGYLCIKKCGNLNLTL